VISLFLSPEQISELDAIVHSKDGDKHYLKRLQSVPLKAVFTTLDGYDSDYPLKGDIH